MKKSRDLLINGGSIHHIYFICLKHRLVGCNFSHSDKLFEPIESS